MNITLTIPDAVATRVIDVMATRFGYQATINGNSNPQTKAQFAKQVVVNWVMAQIVEHETNTTAATASAAQAISTKAEIVIT